VYSDHLDIDVQGARLFVAALGNNTVEVIDLRAGFDAPRSKVYAFLPEAHRAAVYQDPG